MPTGSDLVAWMLARQGAYAYTQHMTHRSDPASGATDCSALVQRAYREVAGIDPGSWTGAQMLTGKQVFGDDAGLPAALSVLQPGDLIFFDWDGHAVVQGDHVEMYVGNGKTIGHGGPGRGPTVKSLASQWAAAHTITARRYLHLSTEGDTMPTAREIADAILDTPIQRQGIPDGNPLKGHATTLRLLIAHADANIIQTNNLVINHTPQQVGAVDAAAIVTEIGKRLS